MARSTKYALLLEIEKKEMQRIRESSPLYHIRQAHPQRFNDVFLTDGEYWQAKIWRDGRYKAIGAKHRDKEKAAQEAVELKIKLGICPNPYREKEIKDENRKKNKSIQIMGFAEQIGKRERLLEESKRYKDENTFEVCNGVTVFKNYFKYKPTFVEMTQEDKIKPDSMERDFLMKFKTPEGYIAHLVHGGKLYKTNYLPNIYHVRKALKIMREYLEKESNNGELQQGITTISGMD